MTEQTMIAVIGQLRTPGSSPGGSVHPQLGKSGDVLRDPEPMGPLRLVLLETPRDADAQIDAPRTVESLAAPKGTPTLTDSEDHQLPNQSDTWK